MSIVSIVALWTLLPICIVFLFCWRIVESEQKTDISLDQCVFSPNKYRPMQRLLQEEDFRFLAAQPGYSAKIGRRFRAERRRIFRAYLRHLRKDFSGMSLVVKALIIHSAEDRPELAQAVIRLRLLFAMGMLAVEARLLLYTFGLGTMDVSCMVEYVETMQRKIDLLLAPPQAAMS